MTMNFLSLNYARDSNDISLNRFIRKMPRRIVEFYIDTVNPYKLKELEVLGAKGYEVTLPYTYEYAKKNADKINNSIKKMLADFKPEEIEIIAPGFGVNVPNIIPVAEGKMIFAFYVLEVINKVLKHSGKDLGNTEFLIIDGGNFLTDLVIDVVYPNVNYLSIYTDRKENFDEKVNFIYEDYGLNLQIFTNSKNDIIKEADVIINCANDMENYDYFFKRNSLYIDINKNKPKLKRLINRRRDMIFVDDFKVKAETHYLMAAMYEAVEHVKNNKFKMFLSNNYNSERQILLNKYFIKNNIIISDLYCCERRLTENDFQKSKNLKT